jgi:hypothetical protein
MNEVNMLGTVVPKSNQLNADDLVGGQTKTIKISKVSGSPSQEQPVAISYEGDNRKPYMPCKSMRRVIIHCWGPDSKDYIGRSLTLFRDDNVLFGGIVVGGLRISHMTNISGPITIALTATQKTRKPYTVQPMIAEPSPYLPDWIADIEAVPTLEGLEHKFKEAAKLFKGDERVQLIAAKDKRKAELTPKEEVANVKT